MKSVTDPPARMPSRPSARKRSHFQQAVVAPRRSMFEGRGTDIDALSAELLETLMTPEELQLIDEVRHPAKQIPPIVNQIITPVPSKLKMPSAQPVLLRNDTTDVENERRTRVRFETTASTLPTTATNSPPSRIAAREKYYDEVAPKLPRTAPIPRAQTAGLKERVKAMDQYLNMLQNSKLEQEVAKHSQGKIIRRPRTTPVKTRMMTPPNTTATHYPDLTLSFGRTPSPHRGRTPSRSQSRPKTSNTARSRSPSPSPAFQVFGVQSLYSRPVTQASTSEGLTATYVADEDDLFGHHEEENISWEIGTWDEHTDSTFAKHDSSAHESSEGSPLHPQRRLSEAFASMGIMSVSSTSKNSPRSHSESPTHSHSLPNIASSHLQLTRAFPGRDIVSMQTMPATLFVPDPVAKIPPIPAKLGKHLLRRFKIEPTKRYVMDLTSFEGRITPDLPPLTEEEIWAMEAEEKRAMTPIPSTLRTGPPSRLAMLLSSEPAPRQRGSLRRGLAGGSVPASAATLLKRDIVYRA